MKSNSIQRKIDAILSILFLFLFPILCAPKSCAQSTKNKDSALKSQLVESIEGTPQEIDSILKIINDYPELKSQYRTLENILKSERELSFEVKSKLATALKLQGDWNTQTVLKEIKRLRRRSTIMAIKGVAGGAGAGALITVIVFAFKT